MQGHLLRDKRMAKSLSQSRLAELAGIKQQHLSLIESGRIQPRIDTLERICEALGLAVNIQPAFEKRKREFEAFNRWEEAQPLELDLRTRFQRAQEVYSFSARESQGAYGLLGVLSTLTQILEEQKVPHMVIGAMAAIYWGAERSTWDVDLSISAGPNEAKLVGLLTGRFTSRAPDPIQFSADTRILPLVVHGTKADLIFTRLPYEEKALGRAREGVIEDRRFKVISLEDLIIYKIISERWKDQDDVLNLLKRNRNSIDRDYLDSILHDLALGLSRPAIWNDYIAIVEPKK